MTRLALAAALAITATPGLCPAQSNQAQPPGQISYQGFLTDANGIPLATNTPQNFNVSFNIYAASSGSTALWGESQVVTVDRGFFTVLLGAGNTISGTFHTNDLTALFNTNNAQTRYIGLTVAGVGSGEIAPRLQLLSSPYALLAANAINATWATNALNVTGANTISATNLAANIGVWTASGGNVYRTSGNVGIGTSSPSQALTVAGDVGIGTGSGDYHVLQLGGGNSFGYLYGSFPALGDGLSLGYNYYYDAAGTAHCYVPAGPTSRLSLGYGSIALATGAANTAPTPRLTVSAAGYVGIGTGLPAALLSLESSAQGLERLRLAGQEFYQAGNTDTDGISFLAGINRVGNRQLWIADSAKLARTSTNPVIRIQPDSSTIDAVATDGVTALPLVLGRNSVVQVGVNNNVGIAATPYANTTLTLGSSWYQLSGINMPTVNLMMTDASGTNQWAFLVTPAAGYANAPGSGDLAFAPGGSITCGFRKVNGATWASSDVRLKTDILGMDDVLDRVLRLRPVAYHFKGAPSEEPKSVGLIAQEVEPLFPDMVGEFRGYKTLTYSDLIPVTIKAIQELNTAVRGENEALRTRNQVLEQQVAGQAATLTELKARLERLEAALQPSSGASK